ncbi:MAG TPA: hypothetical protein VN376_10275 [Longilinea sp.]|nr:hypothetical protein [Longilinea sp.]
MIEITRTISEILTAGIAITAFSLLLFALSLNLRDRVMRLFALILLDVTVIFATEAFGTSAPTAWEVEFWLHMQWVGIVLLPGMYFNLSDILLATMGKPSKWKRRLVVRITYFGSFLFLLGLPIGILVGPVVLNEPPAPHLQPTLITDVFTLYYLVVMAMTFLNFLRSYRRAVTETSKRRLGYLLLGATAPALGSFPYLLFGSNFASSNTLVFWLLAGLANFLVVGLLIVMAYAVSFFGASWPDRVVKTRLLRWILRGPVTAGLVLALTTMVRRSGSLFTINVDALIPVITVATIILMQFIITVFVPYLEKWLFFDKDDQDLAVLTSLQDRLLTRNDLNQFLELVLGAVIDHLQATGAFIVLEKPAGLQKLTSIGKPLPIDLSSDGELPQWLRENSELEDPQRFKEWWVIVLRDGVMDNTHELVGYLFISGATQTALLPEMDTILSRLVIRTGLALRDWQMQEQVFLAAQKLTPQVDLIQRLRAAGRFNRNAVLNEEPAQREEVAQYVRDALTHYWGGPRLTENPLVEMHIVQNALEGHEQNSSNALRAILRDAIDKLKPEGERRYTAEWILYNILVMKFLEGKKVREIASRLAISEADLYRKQRVAIDEVARIMLTMEQELV